MTISHFFLRVCLAHASTCARKFWWHSVTVFIHFATVMERVHTIAHTHRLAALASHSCNTCFLLFFFLEGEIWNLTWIGVPSKLWQYLMTIFNIFIAQKNRKRVQNELALQHVWHHNHYVNRSKLSLHHVIILIKAYFPGNQMPSLLVLLIFIHTA